MVDLEQTLRQALRQFQALRQQADASRATLGEDNYRELSETLTASEADVRRQIVKNDARLEWERGMLADFSRLRGSA